MAPYTLASSPSTRAFSPSAVAVLTFVIVGLVVLCFVVALVYSFVVPSVMRLVRRAPVEDEENLSSSVVIISGPEKTDSPTPIIVHNKTAAPHPRSPLARLTVVEVTTASGFGSSSTGTSRGPSPLRKCVSLETIREEAEEITTPVYLVEVNVSTSDTECKDIIIINKFLSCPRLASAGEISARFGTPRRTAFVSKPSPLREVSIIRYDDDKHAAPITTDVEAFSIAESIAVALANSSSSDFTPISEDMVNDEDEDPFAFDIGRPVPPSTPFIDVPTIVIVDTDLVQAPAPMRTSRQRSNSFMGRKHGQTVCCTGGATSSGRGSTKHKEKENNGYLQVPSAEPPKSKRSSSRRAVAVCRLIFSCFPFLTPLS
ncbi:hypothetical protein R3P38DRAFT_1303352 [Favolaschia claudopus]|uniref:Membrane-associated protein n=1 Tax=Favolaschia claudopus TaxID=2862362 RepID=A0AAW0AZ72_9AGAR